MDLSSALVRACLIFLIEDVFNWLCVLGPNELSIVDVEMIPYIIGPQGLPKGPSKINLYVNTISLTWFPLPVWDGRRNLLSGSNASNHNLISVRNLRRHAQIRKPWNNAFQSAALIDYEDMLMDRASQFMTHLQRLCQDEVCVDLANVISLFSFVFRLPYYYHTCDAVIASILWVISRNSLSLFIMNMAIDPFTLDSAMNIPSFVMGMKTVFCPTYEKDFCKGLIVLDTSMF